eukprot:m.91341 g.91341  ORF g.91341 m.91341 type:complete len:112 (+) comp14632_c0_seq1:116-451(+)
MDCFWYPYSPVWFSFLLEVQSTNDSLKRHLTAILQRLGRTIRPHTHHQASIAGPGHEHHPQNNQHKHEEDRENTKEEQNQEQENGHDAHEHQAKEEEQLDREEVADAKLVA